jgi:hypothetical protein
MPTTPRRDARLSALLATPDRDERHVTILYALGVGRPCDEIARNADEHAFCEAMRPGVEDMRRRGIAVDTAAVPR